MLLGNNLPPVNILWNWVSKQRLFSFIGAPYVKAICYSLWGREKKVRLHSNRVTFWEFLCACKFKKTNTSNPKKLHQVHSEILFPRGDKASYFARSYVLGRFSAFLKLKTQIKYSQMNLEQWKKKPNQIKMPSQANNQNPNLLVLLRGNIFKVQ